MPPQLAVKLYYFSNSSRTSWKRDDKLFTDHVSQVSCRKWRVSHYSRPSHVPESMHNYHVQNFSFDSQEYSVRSRCSWLNWRLREASTHSPIHRCLFQLITLTPTTSPGMMFQLLLHPVGAAVLHNACEFHRILQSRHSIAWYGIRPVFVVDCAMVWSHSLCRFFNAEVYNSVSSTERLKCIAAQSVRSGPRDYCRGT